MGYVFDDVTGRIKAIFATDTPTPPSGFTFTTDAIANDDIVDSKRNISGAVIQKRDALKVSGSKDVPRDTVGEIAIQKIDGTTLAEKTAPSDNDAVVWAIEDPNAFIDDATKNLASGADSVKVGAPSLAGTARILVRSAELQLLVDEVTFS